MIHFRHPGDPVFHSIVRHDGQVILKLMVEADTLALFRDILQQCWAICDVT